MSNKQSTDVYSLQQSTAYSEGRNSSKNIALLIFVNPCSLFHICGKLMETLGSSGLDKFCVTAPGLHCLSCLCFELVVVCKYMAQPRAVDIHGHPWTQITPIAHGISATN